MQAGVAALNGDRGLALGLYAEATQKWDEMNVVLDGALVRAEMALLLGLDEPATRAAFEESRDVLQRLRARPLLEFLDRIEADAGSVVSHTNRRKVAPSTNAVVESRIEAKAG
jgi:hypothetical protein